MKIRSKIFLYIIIPTTIVFYLLSSYILKHEEMSKKEALKSKIESTNKIVEYVVTEPLWNYDLETLKSNINSFFSQPEIAKIQLKEDDGRILVDKRRGENEPDISYQIAIIKADSKIGSVEIGYTFEFINKEIMNTRLKLYIFIGMVFVIILIATTIISKIIYYPINKTVEGMKRVDEGNFNYRLNLEKNDEFKSIEIYFNKMIESLKKSSFENKRYLQEITEKNDELEAAYNEMMSINETLAETLKDFEISENKYRNIFNYAPDGMIIINTTTMRVEEFNREFLNILNIGAIDVINMLVGDLFSEDDMGIIIKKLKEQGVVYNQEIKLKNTDKEIIISLIPLEHNRDYVQIVIKDITEIKKLQVELEEYAKSLEIKVKERTKEVEDANEKIKLQQEELIKEAYNRGFVEVTSGIIHNIGNIVNVINLNVENMISQFPEQENMAIKFLNEVVYKELENLENKSARVVKIIEVMPKVIGNMIEFEDKIKENFEFLMKNIGHLKEIVKLQQSYVGSLGTEDYGDINEIIREALEIFGSSIEKREIELITELGDPKIILCDKNQIFQVISNFIKNSYEAIEEAGRESGKIAIRSLVEEGMVAVYIADNGVGIKKENMENIFGFGFSTKKNTGKGSGFGLHSAMTIISKYSGKISLESEYGKGTQFKITLPLYRNKEREERDEK